MRQQLKYVFYTCLLLALFHRAVSQRPEMVLPVGHTAAIRETQFSRDGKKIVTVSDDGTAKLWDIATGMLLKDVKAFNDASLATIKAARFTPDGNFIVVIYDAGLIMIWDLTTNREYSQYYKEGYISDTTHIDQFGANGKRTGSIRVGAVLGIHSERNHEISRLYKDDGDGLSGQLIFRPDVNKIALDTFNQQENYSRADVYNSKTGEGLYTLDKLVYNPLDTVFFFSPDGKRIIAPETDATVKIRSAASGRVLLQLKGFNERVNIARFSADGRKIVTGSNHTVRIWDAGSGALLKNIKGFTGGIYTALFSPDGKRVIAASDDSSAAVWDIVTGKLLATLKDAHHLLTRMQFSPDGKSLVAVAADNTAKIWDSFSGKMISHLKGYTNAVTAAEFSKDGKKVSIFSPYGAMVFDIKNGSFTIDRDAVPVKKQRLIVTDKGDTLAEKNSQYEISPDKSTRVHWIANIINYIQGKFTKQDLDTVEIYGEQTSNPFGANGPPLPDSGIGYQGALGLTDFVSGIRFSADSKKILINCRDNTVSLYDLELGVTVFTFFALDSTDYLVLLPAGYYLGTQGAAKLLHYVTSDLKIISFAQLDVNYNRPHLVLQAIGGTDSTVLNTFRNAYYKRIKKLGIDTLALNDSISVPEADFANRKSIAAEQKNELLSLHVNATARNSPLNRFNVWINEVPLYGQRGLPVRSSPAGRFDTTVLVRLSQGENRIETTVTAVNGSESFRIPLQLNYHPPAPVKENTLFVGIGIDRFADARHNLRYCSKDIHDLAIALKDKYGSSITIDTLFNESVTVENVKALKRRLQQTGVNDKIIVSYSGHGLLNAAYDYFLSTYAVNFKKPEENGLRYDELENLLDSIPARRKLMLIDACHSGELDKDALLQQKEGNTAGSGAVVPAGPEMVNTSSVDIVEIANAGEDEVNTQLKNSFELMQSLFVNVGKSTGATIISAAAGTEFALEMGNLKNGVFTYCVMDALRNHPVMKISELKRIVGAGVEKLTNGMQKPTSRNESIAVDWNIW